MYSVWLKNSHVIQKFECVKEVQRQAKHVNVFYLDYHSGLGETGDNIYWEMFN